MAKNELVVKYKDDEIKITSSDKFPAELHERIKNVCQDYYNKMHE